MEDLYYYVFSQLVDTKTNTIIMYMRVCMCVHVCVCICVSICVFHETFGLKEGLFVPRNSWGRDSELLGTFGFFGRFWSSF